jgi:hypothetical protein
MNLLLLLTALFASLTGTGSGERGVRQVEGVAVVRAAEVAQAAVQRTSLVHADLSVPARTSAEPRKWTPFEAQTLPSARLPFERRLE